MASSDFWDAVMVVPVPAGQIVLLDQCCKFYNVNPMVWIPDGTAILEKW